MAVDLEALDEELESTSRELLGDTITYTPHGGSPRTFKAIVDYGDGERELGGSGVISPDRAVEVPRSIIASVDPRDTIHLHRLRLDHLPKGEAKLDETGMNWLVLLKRKPG